ncbi:hypothetical protein BDN72DRAFT_96931 [Pluteus cervinus]|uniref:Uncharacterized protein n=1 Tax=Pluteus cervinus TaxID=181527 RepID=A0ACD3ANY9_9AGAR|nr:hypothetical protein BDN72DRAFT_96931 [Pluteus cervinus]
MVFEIWQFLRLHRPDASPLPQSAEILSQRIFTRIKKWLLGDLNLDGDGAIQLPLKHQRLPANIEERIKICALGIHRLCWYTNRMPPCTLKAVFADLAWTVNDLANLLKPPVAPNPLTKPATSSRIQGPRQGLGSSPMASRVPGREVTPALKSFLGAALREDHWLQLFQVTSLNPASVIQAGTTGGLWFREYLAKIGYGADDDDDPDEEEQAPLDLKGQDGTVDLGRSAVKDQDIEVHGNCCLPFSRKDLQSGS